MRWSGKLNSIYKRNENPDNDRDGLNKFLQINGKKIDRRNGVSCKDFNYFET